MKKWIKIVTVISASLLVASSVLTVPASAATKKNAVLTRIEKKHVMLWGTKADTRLMGLMDIKTGKIQGFDVDMAKALTKIIDPKAKAEFTQVTSGTRIPLLKNGNIDAIIATMSITPERAKVVDFTKPYFLAGQSLLVQKGSKIANIQDVNHKGVTVVGVAGSTSVQTIAKLAPKSEVLALPDYATALSALKAGQGDVLTTDSGIIAGMAEEDKSLKMVGGTFTNEPYGIAFAKDNPELVKKTNAAIDELHKNGTYAKLIKKWFSTVPGMNWKEMAK